MFSSCLHWGILSLTTMFIAIFTVVYTTGIAMKFYRFVARTWNVTVGQGKFRSEAQVRRVAQQLTSSMGYPVEFEEISELAPNLPIFASDSFKGFDIFIFSLGASLLGLLIGIILFQVFMPNQSNQTIERLFPSQVLPK